MKVDAATGQTVDVFNTNKDLRLMPQYQCGDYYLEHLCGRPMAMQFDKDGLRLIVLDAYKGLLSINLEENTFEYLTREVNGDSFKFLHSMAVSQSTGRIYFTESSTRVVRREYMSEILEARGRGRLLVFDPASLSTSVLATKLRFPSGLVVQEADGEDVALIFSETSRGRVRKCNLKFSRREEPTCSVPKTFAEAGLPCLPGDLTWEQDSRSLWVGCALPRSPLYQAISNSPVLRQTLGSFRSDLAELLFKVGADSPALARLSSKGKVTAVLEDTAANSGCMYRTQPLSPVSDQDAKDGDAYKVLLTCPHTSVSSPWVAELGTK